VLCYRFAAWADIVRGSKVAMAEIVRESLTRQLHEDSYWAGGVPRARSCLNGVFVDVGKSSARIQWEPRHLVGT